MTNDDTNAREKGGYEPPMRRPRTMRQMASHVEQQIAAAEARGEFDNLPGKGKPIPGLDAPHDELWWVRGLLKRENLDYLPGHLSLRRDAERALSSALAAPSELAARRIVSELNEKIANHNRTVTSGPASDLAPIDVDAVLRKRRERRGEG